MDVLLGWLLPEAPNQGGPVGFVLFALTILAIMVCMIMVGRARRYRLEAERFSMRAEECARRAEDATRNIDRP